MDIGIKGKKALVTGASRGIGFAVAEALALEGVSVALISRTIKSDRKFRTKKNDNYFTLEYDLTRKNAPTKAINKVIDNFGIPDIIIHNLGGNLNVTDPLCSIDDWRRVYRLNLEVAIEINNLIIPLLRKNKWGRIVHISSIASLENQGTPPYCAMKAALNAYVRSVGRYVSSDGISMSSVLPGAILTQDGYWDIAQKQRPEHVEKYLKERMAIKRFGSLNEISKFVVFLCSEFASFIVGSQFLADGGQGRCF